MFSQEELTKIKYLHTLEDLRELKRIKRICFCQSTPILADGHHAQQHL